MKIEEMLKQTQAGMALTEEYTGVCPYCGQMKHGLLPMGLNWSQEDIDEYVAETCDCAESMVYSRKKRQKEAAMRQIEILFGTESDQQQKEEILFLLRGGQLLWPKGICRSLASILMRG